ncbi:MAG: S8 family serine peptidase [Planctomycetota bacterium]
MVTLFSTRRALCGAVLTSLLATAASAQHDPQVLVTVEPNLRRGLIAELLADLQAEAAYHGGVGQNNAGIGYLYDFPTKADGTAFIATIMSGQPVPSLAPTLWRELIVDADHVTWGSLAGGDPLLPSQYALANINWTGGDSLLQMSNPDDVVVAVLDSGVSPHPDLTANLLPGINADDPAGSTGDDLNHGTHIAGIVGAEIDNGLDMAGVARNASILPVRITEGEDDAVSSLTATIGIKKARKQGAKVMTMSFTVPTNSQLADAVSDAVDQDVVMIAAAGNDGSSNQTFPGGYNGVMAVAATDQNDILWPSSNFSWMSMAAPGVDVVSLSNTSGTMMLSGTCVAAAHVAGVAAALRGICSNAGEKDIRKWIRQGANPFVGGLVPNLVSQGRLDYTASAVRAATLCAFVNPPPVVTPILVKGNPAFAAGWTDQNLTPITLPSTAAAALMSTKNDGQEFLLRSVPFNGIQEGRVSLLFNPGVFPGPGEEYDFIRLRLSVRKLGGGGAANRDIEVRPKDWDDDKWGNDDWDSVNNSGFVTKVFEFNEDLDDLVRDDGLLKFRLRVVPDGPLPPLTPGGIAIDFARVVVALK